MLQKATRATQLYHQCNQSTHGTDGVTVTTLSASLIQKINVATNHLCQTALNGKLLHKFEKRSTISSRVKGNRAKQNLLAFLNHLIRRGQRILLIPSDSCQCIWAKRIFKCFWTHMFPICALKEYLNQQIHTGKICFIKILSFVNQSCASSGDSELDKVSSGWITSPWLSKFGGS